MKAAAQPTQETSRHGQVENDLVGYEERRNIESFKQDLSCSLSARRNQSYHNKKLKGRSVEMRDEDISTHLFFLGFIGVSVRSRG
jgi:hypothetical protein